MAKATAKRKVIVESTGEAHISATFNNIIISLTNKKVKLFLVFSW
jgi:small subunit ribosomal protein S11